jgi:GNAT superfamily N-acetyltransferase
MNGSEQPTMSTHPCHSLIVTCVRQLYSESVPEAGIVVEQLPIGLLRYNLCRPTSCDVYPRGVLPEGVPEFIERITRDYPDRAMDICLDDRGMDELLGPALFAAGLEQHSATTYLAYCRDTPQDMERDDVTVESVRDDAELRELVRTKLMGFANSECEPSNEALDGEFAVRKDEMPIGARYVLARVGGEAAAMVSYYEMQDSLIFQLATRLPFRNRGIARCLMERTVRERLVAGARSVLVNCDEEGLAVKLYRRLGFVDEVYWRRLYSFPQR